MARKRKNLKEVRPEADPGTDSSPSASTEASLSDISASAAPSAEELERAAASVAANAAMTDAQRAEKRLRGGVRNSPSRQILPRPDVDVALWYGRLSIEKSGLNAGSWKQGQISMRDAWLRARPNASLVASFFDDGVSGEDVLNLKEREKALAVVRAGRVSVFLCEAVDRIGRNATDLLAVWNTLRASGVRLVTIRHGEMSDMLFHLLAGIAQSERRNTSDRVRRSRPIHIGGGRVLGLCSYGYDVDEQDRLVINRAEARVVKFIFSLYATTFIGIAQIADILTELRIPAPGGGERWHPTQLGGCRVSYDDEIERQNGMLCRPAYKGMRRTGILSFKRGEDGKARGVFNPRDKWQEVACPAIVSEELYAKVAKRLADLEMGHDAHTYLLSGLLHCATCGGTMVCCSGTPKKASPWGVATRIRCSASRTGGCAHTDQYDIGEVQAAVVVLLERHLLDGRVEGPFREALSEPDASVAGEIATLKAKLKKQHAIVQNLITDKAACPDLAGIYDGAIEKGNGQYLRLRSALERLEGIAAQAKARPDRTTAVEVVSKFIDGLPRNLAGVTDVSEIVALQRLRDLVGRVNVGPLEGRSRCAIEILTCFGSIDGELFAAYKSLSDDAREVVAAVRAAPGALDAHRLERTLRKVLSQPLPRTLSKLSEYGVLREEDGGYRLEAGMGVPDTDLIFRCVLVETDGDVFATTRAIDRTASRREGRSLSLDQTLRFFEPTLAAGSPPDA